MTTVPQEKHPVACMSPALSETLQSQVPFTVFKDIESFLAEINNDCCTAIVIDKASTKNLNTCIQEIRATAHKKEVPVVYVYENSEELSALSEIADPFFIFINKSNVGDELEARIHQLKNATHTMDNNKSILQVAYLGRASLGITHNLNNQLGIIVGYLDLLEIKKNDPEFVEKSLAHIRTAIDRAINILRNVGKMGSNLSLKGAQQSLRFLLEKSVTELDKPHDNLSPLALEFNVPEETVTKLYAETFNEVLSHVVTNAQEAHKEAGKSSIPIQVRINPSNGTEVIEVEDEGNGVAKEISENIFEPFVSSKSGASRGLGLTIARYIIRRSGGELGVTTNNNGGTTVCITLPKDD